MATSYPVERGHSRGKLSIYLGAAPGVGKTYAMLAEGQRRRARGTDVVGALTEALRRRMVHGNIYPPNRIEAALTHYFRPGNLTALRARCRAPRLHRNSRDEEMLLT